MGLIRFLYHNKSSILTLFLFYFLFWLTIQNFKQSTDFNKTQVSSKNSEEKNIFLFLKQLNRLKHISNSTFYVILNHFFELKLNLILIDPYVLNYLFIRQLSFDQLEKQLITFAIIDESVETVFESIQQTNFSIKLSKTILSNQKISIGHIFIEYQQKIIHLAVLHKYHSYYLIHKNNLPLSDDIQLSYGDKLRAIEK
jgi:hypothetical protein